MESVSTLIYAQYILQRSSSFSKRSKQLFSSVRLGVTEGYFFVVHNCLSYCSMLGLFLTTTSYIGTHSCSELLLLSRSK